MRLGEPLEQLDGFAGPPRLPDVLCIGAQRSGTTRLHGALHAAVSRTGFSLSHFSLSPTELQPVTKLVTACCAHLSCDMPSRFPWRLNGRRGSPSHQPDDSC
jgi:hypothetical protein